MIFENEIYKNTSGTFLYFLVFILEYFQNNEWFLIINFIYLEFSKNFNLLGKDKNEPDKNEGKTSLIF